jgi:hypothetical protein
MTIQKPLLTDRYLLYHNTLPAVNEACNINGCNNILGLTKY